MLGLLRGQFVLSKLFLARPAALNLCGINLVTRAAITQIASRGFSTSHLLGLPATKTKTTTTRKVGRPAASTGAKKGTTAKAGGRRKTAIKATTKVKAKPKKKVVKKTVRKPKVAKKPTLKITTEMRRPKKPTTPFLIFATKFVKASDQPKATLADHAILSRQASEVWNTLSTLEKQPFHDEARALLPAYEKKYAAWVLKMKETPAIFTKMNKTRKARGMTKMHLPQPPPGERRPANSFILFSVEHNKNSEFNGMHSSERAKALGAQWKALSDSQKKPYIDQYHANLEDYKRQNSV